MPKISLFWIVLVLSLAACTGQATPPSQQNPSPTQVEEITPTQAPTAGLVGTATQTDPARTVESLSQETPTVSTPVASEAVTYQFVPAESQVTYEVGEVFLDQGNAFNVAIGVTQQISGTVQVDFNQPKNSSLSTVTVDISQFQSDSARRDRAIRERFLESASFPIATFVPDKIEGLPDAVQEGVDYVLKVTGNLTIREVTKPASFDVTVRLEGGALQGQANTTILMSDYGFGPIDLLGTLKTEDEVKVSLQFVARPVV